MTARGVRSLVALGLTLVGLPAAADRLRLEGGGEIQAVAWWVEGETLYYEGTAGTIGIPRSMVVAVEPRGSTHGGENRSPARAPDPAPSPEPALSMETVAERMEFAGEALERREFSIAADAFESLLRQSPELGAARLGAAIARLALDQDVLALGLVLDGLVKTPDDPRLLELLGDLRNREERVEDGLRSWRSAFAVAPGDRLREKILKGERELHVGRTYETIRTAHFNARFDGDIDRQVANEMIAYLEEQFWDLAGEFRHTPSQPITALIYPDSAFRDVTESPGWVGGVFDGKIRVPLGGLRKLDSRGRDVLRHELTHAVVHSKSRGNCPRWLHEGLAQQAEGKSLGRTDRRAIAARLAKGEPESWEADGFSYPMALSLTLYLHSLRGPAGMVELLERLGDGQSIDDALRAVYGEHHKGLARRWATAVARGGIP